MNASPALCAFRSSGRPIVGAGGSERLQALQNAEGAMQRALHRAEIVLAVPAAIGHVARQKIIKQLVETIVAREEMGGKVQDHAVHAHVAVVDGLGVVDAAVAAARSREHQFHAFLRLGLSATAKAGEIEKRVVRRGPVRLIEASAPMPVSTARGEEALSPARACDARTSEIGAPAVLAQQIAPRLEFDGRIAGKQPIDDASGKRLAKLGTAGAGTAFSFVRTALARTAISFLSIKPPERTLGQAQRP